jgi:hypothetical protein
MYAMKRRTEWSIRRVGPRGLLAAITLAVVVGAAVGLVAPGCDDDVVRCDDCACPDGCGASRCCPYACPVLCEARDECWCGLAGCIDNCPY